MSLIIIGSNSLGILYAQDQHGVIFSINPRKNKMVVIANNFEEFICEYLGKEVIVLKPIPPMESNKIENLKESMGDGEKENLSKKIPITKRELANLLEKKLTQTQDKIELVTWAYKIYLDNIRDIPYRLEDILFDIIMMEMGPEFELSLEELGEIVVKLRKESDLEDPLKPEDPYAWPFEEYR